LRVGPSHSTNAVGLEVAAGALGWSALPAAAGVLAGRLGLEAIPQALCACSLAVLLIHEALLAFERRQGRAAAPAPDPC
jgi:hypothetical protein